MFSMSEDSMGPLEKLLWLSVETGNAKFKMADAKPDIPVSQLLYRTADISTANPMFSGSGNSVALLEIISVVTESQKCKISAAKTDAPVSQLIYKIAKEFQRLFACFRSRESQ
jgi:hypothetical protein